MNRPAFHSARPQICTSKVVIVLEVGLTWLSLFGGNASTQVVDTQMLGTVTVEIQTAPATILMTGVAQTAAGVAIADNTPTKTEVGRAAIAAADAQRGAVLAPETADYTLTNLEFRCIRYHMGPEFDQAAANVLGDGAKYKLWYPPFKVDDLFLLIIKLLLNFFQYQLNH